MKKKNCAAVMFQGTGSDVGKSLLVAGLCRASKNRGVSVAPFKPQNMTNNAVVTEDGGEIGGAQALQARAAGIPALSDMNPVLLKPESDRGSQVIVQGRTEGFVNAADYKTFRGRLLPRVMESFERIRASCDVVVVEGAGSASEVNLREGDIANMGFATCAGVPVLLVADIDRGGAIASVVGAHILATEEERAALKGYVVNKFRGDPALFTPALDIIRAHTGLDSFGIMKWFDDARLLPAEDSMTLDRARVGGTDQEPNKIRISVLRLSRISSFDDFDPLAAEEDVALSFVNPGEAIPGNAHLVIVPGTNEPLADLDFIRAQGWDTDIAAHVRRSGHVLGIGGGYQIMGTEIATSEGAGTELRIARGLGLLDVRTVMEPRKELRRFTARTTDGMEVGGYEIRAGRTTAQEAINPMMTLDGRPEGAESRDGRACGCCIHGLFSSDEYRGRFLARFRAASSSAVSVLRYEHRVDAILDALAAQVERDLDVSRIARVAGLEIA